MRSTPIAHYGLLCLTLLALSACGRARKDEAAASTPTLAHWEEVDNPSEAGASAASFHTTDGRLFFTWVEDNGKVAALKQAEFTVVGFDQAATIRSGADWMVHWADLQGAAGTALDRYAWHEVRNPAEEHATDILLYRAIGNGWQGPLEVHAPTPAGEHAFVSGAALPEGGFGLAWLQPSADTVGGHKTELAFRPYLLGKPGDLLVVDSLVCDCCPTAMACTDSTVLLAYRDRSPTGVRDISYQLWDRGRWSGTMPLGAEGWEIDGCPVNGPAVAASGSKAVIAWWTQHGDRAEVRFAVSSDYGRTFSQAETIDEEAPIGHVSASIDGKGETLITWLAPLDSGNKAIFAYRYLEGAVDTVAVFPAQQAVGRPVATANPFGEFLVACQGPKGILVFSSER